MAARVSQTVEEVSGEVSELCQYWASGTWWAVYCSGELLDVYESRQVAEGYADYMNRK